MRLNLPVYTYSHRSQPASTARLVNCYPELMPPGGKAPVLLTRSPGVKAWSTVGSGSIKGMYRAKIGFSDDYGGRVDRLYVVSGRELYAVDAAKSATLLGDIGTDSGIDFAHNTDSLVVVNNPRGYYYDGRAHAGTHTAAGNNATVMTDSAATFIPDALIGLDILNTTDGSVGLITDNDETTVTVAALYGGTDNDWDTSDAYFITSLRKIDDEDFTSRGAASVDFLENFLLFREPDSDRMFGANLGSATQFDALDFVNSDTNPDLLLDMISVNRSLLCFSEETTEFFENTGVSGFPFERNINGTMQVGIAASGLVGIVFDMVHFIADDNTVRRVEGNQPVKISTHSIERFIENATLDQGHVFSYTKEGHFFIGFTFPEGTIVFDSITQEWHNRASYREEYWRPSFITKFDGKWLAGDPLSNAIVEIDDQTYSDSLADQYTSSNVQRMEWTYQPVYAEQMDAFHDRLEVVFDVGSGLTIGQGSDPKMMMQYSDDSGRTWKALPDRSMGKRGKYLDRVHWENLGKSKARVYRGAVSDPIPVTITDTVIEVRGGRL